MTMVILLSIIIICFTILMGETMYFNHKEKMKKLDENKILNNKKEE